MNAAAATRQGAGRTGDAAWRSSSAWAWMLIVCILSIAFDLGSKSIAFRTVADQPLIIDRERVLAAGRDDPSAVNRLVPFHKPVVAVPSVLNFTLVLNPGAVFGIGPGQRWFFVGFTVIALGFGLLMFARWTTAADRAAHIGIGLLIGGGLGNLYDRLVYGCVRDFLHPLPGVKWPFGLRLTAANGDLWPYVSNVADLFLLIGIALLLIHLWRKDKAAKPSAVTAS